MRISIETFTEYSKDSDAFRKKLFTEGEPPLKKALERQVFLDALFNPTSIDRRRYRRLCRKLEREISKIKKIKRIVNE